MRRGPAITRDPRSGTSFSLVYMFHILPLVGSSHHGARNDATVIDWWGYNLPLKSSVHCSAWPTRRVWVEGIGGFANLRFWAESIGFDSHSYYFKIGFGLVWLDGLILRFRIINFVAGNGKTCGGSVGTYTYRMDKLSIFLRKPNKQVHKCARHWNCITFTPKYPLTMQSRFKVTVKSSVAVFAFGLSPIPRIIPGLQYPKYNLAPFQTSP